jgi:endonuclease III
MLMSVRMEASRASARTRMSKDTRPHAPPRLRKHAERPRSIDIVPTRRGKKPFDLDEMFKRLRVATAPFKKAAMFELADRGYDSVFQILVGCIISIRTLDEVSLPTALKLFEHAPTPKDIAQLSVAEIDRVIHDCSFHEPKARQIRDIAIRTVNEFHGELPCDLETLTSFHGVGPKCANLALGIACGQSPGISVDIHVHRVTNRWGLVRATTPEKTMAALMDVLPRRLWVQSNALLVPFGKHVCTGVAPRCSACPLLRYCRQVGVTSHR